MAEIKYDTSVISTVINCAESMGGAYQEMINLLNDAYKKANELQLVYDKIFEKYNEIKAELDNINNEYNNLNEELDVISFGTYYEDIDYKNDTKEEIARKEAYNAQARIEEEEERQRINNSINELLTKIQEMQEILNNAQQELNKAKEELNNAKEKAESFYETLKDFNLYLNKVYNEIGNDIDTLNNPNKKNGPKEFSFTDGEKIDISNQYIEASGKALDFFRTYGSVDQNGLADLLDSANNNIYNPIVTNEMTEIIAKSSYFDVAIDVANKLNEQQNNEIERLIKFVADKYGMSEDDAYITMRSLNLEGACTYADTCNLIYQLYDFDNAKFEKEFGYPIINNDGTLNGNQLLLDLYIYQNIDTTNTDNATPLFKKNDDGNIILNANYLDNYESSPNKVFDASKQQYMDIDGCSFRISSFDGKNYSEHIEYESYSGEKLFNFLKYNNSSYNINDYKLISSGPLAEDSYDILKKAILDGKPISLKLYADWTLYPTNSDDKSVHVQNEGHAVTVVGITQNGVIVRSWKEEFYVPYDDIEYFTIIEEVQNTKL